MLSWYVTNGVFTFQAQQLNKDIFETIYYHSLKASAELAAKEGPYETYEGCPVSKVFFYSFFLIKLLILSNVRYLIFFVLPLCLVYPQVSMHCTSVTK